jgi:hypothetical protein
MAKALAGFKFRRLVKTFLWNQATMMRFRCVTYCALSELQTPGGIKQMGTDSRSENGRCAWVALCAHATHTDIEPFFRLTF